MVSLEWKDNSTSETKFVLERKTSSTDYAQLGVISQDVTVYDDTSVEPSTTYYYRVKAGTDKLNPQTLKFTTSYTAYSNELMVKTPAASSSIITKPFGDIKLYDNA